MQSMVCQTQQHRTIGQPTHQPIRCELRPDSDGWYGRTSLLQRLKELGRTVIHTFRRCDSERDWRLPVHKLHGIPKRYTSGY